MTRGIQYSDSCRERNPNFEPYGKMDGLTWWVITGELLQDKKGVKRPEYKRAVQLIYEDRYGDLKDDELLHKMCKTRGCMNTEHYELRKRTMISRDQARIFYEQAVTTGRATLPYHDSNIARQERMGFYPHRAWFKKHDPLFYEQIENMELVIRSGALVCQAKGADKRTQDAWKEANLPTQSASEHQEQMLQVALADMKTNAPTKVPDPSNDLIKGMFSTPADAKLHDKSDVEDYGQEMNDIIAKANHSGLLTPEENRKLMAYHEEVKPVRSAGTFTIQELKDKKAAGETLKPYQQKLLDKEEE